MRLNLFLAAVAPIVASAVAWGVIFFCIPYRDQDFPLNDDWAYALSAFKFARGGGVDYFDWAAMPQLGMWIWAYPAISFLGTSNAALRLSTIVLSWIGVSAFRDLLRQAGLGPWIRLLRGCRPAFQSRVFHDDRHVHDRRVGTVVFPAGTRVLPARVRGSWPLVVPGRRLSRCHPGRGDAPERTGRPGRRRHPSVATAFSQMEGRCPGPPSQFLPCLALRPPPGLPARTVWSYIRRSRLTGAASSS